MSKARTVPGEDLSSRLSARAGSRARVGPQRSFYQRLGVSDPLGEDPEVEAMAGNGLFSFLSAQKYYRELRGQRLRMMWRLGAIRHRQVAGERLRAAGPSFAATNVLAGAALPTTGELVLLDHKPAQAAQDEETSMFAPRRRGEPVRRSRRAAIAATERSAQRSEPELARALAQLEQVLKGQTRDRVASLAREIPGAAPSRRAEVVREVLRVVERDAPRHERHDRVGERTSRPLAVASERTRLPSADRRSMSSEQGPRGLQPVLRSSPAVQAASGSLVERVARRPEAIERMVREARATSPVASTVLASPRRSLPGEVAPVAPRAAAPQSEGRVVRRVRPDTTAAMQTPPAARVVREAPTARVARALVAQSIPEGPGAPRGLDARRADHAPTLSRAVARSRAGDAPADTRAPVAGAATNWLSDEAHPQRRIARALAAAQPVAARRTAMLAPEAVGLRPVDADRARSAGEGNVVAAAAPRRTSDRGEAASRTSKRPMVPVTGPSLRAVSRAVPDADRVAASPIRVRMPAPALPSALLLRPAPAELVAAAAPVRGRSVGRTAPLDRQAVTAPKGASGSSAPSATRRALERVDRQDPALRAVAPLVEAATSVLRPVGVRVADEVAQRGAHVARRVQPAALDLVALTPAADRDVPVQPSGAPRRAAGSRAAEARSAGRAPRAEFSASPSGAVRARTAAPGARVAPTRPEVLPALGPRRALPVATGATAAQGRVPGAAAIEGGGSSLRGRPEHRAVAPATRRALHRSVEPVAASDRERVALTASPASFVFALRAQDALDASPEAAPTARRDRSATRALARSSRTARVDGSDRARLAPSATDYLPVAAAAAALGASPMRAARRRPEAEPDLSVARRPRGERAAGPSERVAPSRRAAEAEGVAPATTRRLASAAAFARGALPPGGIDLHETTDVAVRPRRARGDRPVVDMRDLVAPAPRGEPAQADAPSGRHERPSLSASLRQVAGAFRAAERDTVQVLTLGAARRAIGASEPGSRASAGSQPTISASIERDAAGRVVAARATRLLGEGAGEQVLLSSADLGADAASSPVTQRAAARGAAAEAPSGVRAPRIAHGAPSVLPRRSVAWAEDRVDAAQPAPKAGEGAGPVREAARRWSRPVPEGTLAAAGAPEVVADRAEGHRLTAPLAPRRRGDRPEPVALSRLGVEADEGDALPTRRRAAHGANTWVDLEAPPSGRAGSAPRAGTPAADLGHEGAPSWARRAVEPAVAERAEREPMGSKVRSGGGLLTALARAGEPEDIVRVILERSHETAALARELGGGAGSLLHEVAAAASGTDTGASASRGRGGRGETVESTTVARGRASTLLGGGGERSRGFRTRSGPTAASEGHDGIGASNVMKLASKLKKLIHLAEHDRRLDDARSQVRMAEDSASARAEVGAGKSGGQGLEDDNVHLEQLREEILREVQHQLEMTKQRGDSDVGNGWW